MLTVLTVQLHDSDGDCDGAYGAEYGAGQQGAAAVTGHNQHDSAGHLAHVQCSGSGSECGQAAVFVNDNDARCLKDLVRNHDMCETDALDIRMVWPCIARQVPC